MKSSKSYVSLPVDDLRELTAAADVAENVIKQNVQLKGQLTVIQKTVDSQKELIAKKEASIHFWKKIVVWVIVGGVILFIGLLIFLLRGIGGYRKY